MDGIVEVVEVVEVDALGAAVVGVVVLGFVVVDAVGVNASAVCDGAAPVEVVDFDTPGTLDAVVTNALALIVPVNITATDVVMTVAAILRCCNR